MSDSVNLSKISNEFSKGSNGKSLNLDLLNISNKTEKLNKLKGDIKSPGKKIDKKDSLLNLAIGMSEGLYQGAKGMVVGTLDIAGNVDQNSIDQIAKYGNSNDLSVGTSLSHTAGGIAHSINLVYHDPHLIAQAFHQVENNLVNGSNLQRGRTLGNIFVFVASTGIGLGGIGKATQIASDVREADLATQGIRAVADADKALTNVNMALAKSTDFLANTSIDATSSGIDSGLRVLTGKLGSDPTSFLSSVNNSGLKIEDGTANLLPNLRQVTSSADEILPSLIANDVKPLGQSIESVATDLGLSKASTVLHADNVLFSESEATGLIKADQTGFKDLTTVSDQITSARPLNTLTSDIPPVSLDKSAAIDPATTVARPLTSDIPPPVSLDKSAAIDPATTVARPLTSDIPPVSLDKSAAIDPATTVARPLTSDIPPVSLDSSSAIDPATTVARPLTSDIPPVSLDSSSAIDPATTLARPLTSDIPPVSLDSASAAIDPATTPRNLTNTSASASAMPKANVITNSGLPGIEQGVATDLNKGLRTEESFTPVDDPLISKELNNARQNLEALLKQNNTYDQSIVIANLKAVANSMSSLTSSNQELIDAINQFKTAVNKISTVADILGDPLVSRSSISDLFKMVDSGNSLAQKKLALYFAENTSINEIAPNGIRFNFETPGYSSDTFSSRTIGLMKNHGMINAFKHSAMAVGGGLLLGGELNYGLDQIINSSNYPTNSLSQNQANQDSIIVSQDNLKNKLSAKNLQDTNYNEQLFSDHLNNDVTGSDSIRKTDSPDPQDTAQLDKPRFNKQEIEANYLFGDDPQGLWKLKNLINYGTVWGQFQLFKPADTTTENEIQPAFTFNPNPVNKPLIVNDFYRIAEAKFPQNKTEFLSLDNTNKASKSVYSSILSKNWQNIKQSTTHNLNTISSNQLGHDYKFNKILPNLHKSAIFGLPSNAPINAMTNNSGSSINLTGIAGTNTNTTNNNNDQKL